MSLQIQQLLQISLLLIFISTINSTTSDKQYTPSDFSGGYFQFNDKKSQLYLVNVFENNDDFSASNTIMAYGEFSSDAFTDFVTVQSFKDSQKTAINLFIWDSDDHNFEKYQVTQFQTGNVLNIIPIDVNYDGLPDLLVFFQEDGAAAGQMLVYVQVDQSKGYKFAQDINNSISNINFAPNTQPFIINYLNNSNQRINQLVYEVQSQDSQNTILRKYMNIDLTENQSIARDFLNLQSSSCGGNKVTVDDLRPFSSPHFNAVVDINGDCRSDIVITSQLNQNQVQVEMWIYQDDGKYCREQVYTLPTEQRQLMGISYADFDFSGSTDVAIIYQSKTTEEVIIQVSLNQVKFDKTKKSNQCEGENWKLSLNDGDSFMQTLTGYKLPTTYAGDNALRVYNQLRYGDINLDGYNDLLLVLVNNETKKQIPYILLNKGAKNAIGQVEFEIQTEKKNYNLDIVENSENLQFLSASFFDINENGIFDIFFNYIDTTTKTLKFASIYNYLSNQNYFLKIRGTNGNKNGGEKATMYYGATFKCTVTTDDTKQQIAQGSQLSQSAYSPLQLPFSLIGLTRTNNYVQNLEVGYPQNQKSNTKVWETIIPNSQLIIYPFTQQTGHWKIDIFIETTSAVIVVIIVVLALLVILGISIFFCHRKEKNEDKKDRTGMLEFY